MRSIFSPTVLLYGLLVFCNLSLASFVMSQPVLSHQTISMGGGTAYLTGPVANFYNPANLMIRDNHRRNRLTLAQGGFSLSEGIGIRNFYKGYIGIEDYFTFYNEDHDLNHVSSDILESRFPDNADLFANTARFDVMHLGISFTRKHHSYSMALRSRGINSIELNRGWYDATPVFGENGEALKRTLRQNLYSFHEVSFGLAGEVLMVNGWLPGLNKLYFGIAPKLIIGSMFFEGDYTTNYFRQPEDDTYHYISNYEAKTVGEISRMMRTTSAPGSNKHQALLETTGLGLGIDLGFTYVMSLKDDLSLAPHSNESLRKSLRFSISMTDLGLVSYYEQPTEFHSGIDTTLIQELPDPITGNFTGQIGEFTNFISSRMGELPQEDITSGGSRLNEMLPATLHIGTALQYNKLLVAADHQYQIKSSQFEDRQWQTSLGTELRLLKFLPLRSGISLNSEMQPMLGLGLGIDAGFWEISLATRLKKGYDDDIYSVGLAMAAMQFRF
ncbi:MAG: DUF5723 family protein [Balneolales bacterium]